MLALDVNLPCAVFVEHVVNLRCCVVVSQLLGGNNIGTIKLQPVLIQKVSASSSTTSSSSTSSSSTAGSIAPGPVTAPPPCTPHLRDTTPELCVSQPYGDGYTVYIIHGTGFAPFATITVRLVGVGVSPDHPVASPDHPVTDLQGAFNYAVDQGHRFFSGPIPPGVYQVTVTAPGGRVASVRFQVNGAANGGPAGPGPGQGGPPP